MPDHANAHLAVLFDETVKLYHRLTADAVTIHRFGSMSGPRRTVLVGLARSGPQTVSDMARARAQSRQRFQPLVNALIADGLVVARPNPRHKQSHLMVLTARGEQTVKQILDMESALRRQFKLSRSPRSVAQAAAVLRDVRLALEDQLPLLLRRVRRRGDQSS
jgi:DNA-binding MarR family transcriptional regulator